MIFTINNQISFPISHFMDLISSAENGIARVVTISANAENFEELSETLVELVESENFDLVLTNGEKIVWKADVFSKMEFYHEIVKNEKDFEEKIGLTFSIEKNINIG